MGTIAQKLAAVASSKAAIGTAIEGRGGTVPTKLSDYGTAVAALPNAYAQGDEGKVVSSGALVAQTSRSITDNGTYDTTTNNSVTVSVSGGGGSNDLLKAIVSRQASPTWILTSEDLDGCTIIGEGAFAKCSGLTSITIPNGVTSIESQAFYRCTGLASITVPNSVTNIGNSAFGYCSSLTSFSIPNTCDAIGGSCFQGCTALTSMTIGNSVIAIGSTAFSGCSGLTSITIPDSVISILGNVFANCSNLATIDFGSTRSTIPGLSSANSFNGLPANYQILVPAALLTNWKGTINWSSIADHIVAHP